MSPTTIHAAGRPRIPEGGSPTEVWRTEAWRTEVSRTEAPQTEGVSRTERRSRILVAGADSEQRAAVLHDLTVALPANTQLREACAVSEVLAQAPSSSVVMLAGDLGEVSAESLMHVLGERHPSLPVVALGLTVDCTPNRDIAPLGW
ncbi:MAG TPA: hypothetical protein VNY52_10995 [Solirubrobacteraceae bacterium]|jgi:hypothetical protein|nr:hypothetical protein [Solirubrobacteraceae bacterium]